MILKRLIAFSCVISMVISMSLPVFAQEKSANSETTTGNVLESSESVDSENLLQSEPKPSDSQSTALPNTEPSSESQQFTETSEPIAQTLKGWNQIEGRWYYFDVQSGVQQVGFQEKKDGADQGWYYYKEDGSLHSEGWHEVNGSLRYVEAKAEYSRLVFKRKKTAPIRAGITTKKMAACTQKAGMK